MFVRPQLADDEAHGQILTVNRSLLVGAAPALPEPLAAGSSCVREGAFPVKVCSPVHLVPVGPALRVFMPPPLTACQQSGSIGLGRNPFTFP